jgi:hypothetical protein
VSVWCCFLISLKLLQRRVFQVSATAAQPEAVPPPTPEANITPAAPPAPPKPTTTSRIFLQAVPSEI